MIGLIPPSVIVGCDAPISADGTLCPRLLILTGITDRNEVPLVVYAHHWRTLADGSHLCIEHAVTR